MRKTQKPGQAPTSVVNPSETKLTWQEERFIETYLDNGGNAKLAFLAANPRVKPTSAEVMGHRLLMRVKDSGALDAEMERRRSRSRFTREKALEILTEMAFATLDDFTLVLKHPGKKEAYVGLGGKKYAIKEASESFKNGNSIKLVDRMAVINELWDKLGLGEDASETDRVSFLERFARMGSRLGRGDSGGQQNSGEGS